MSLLAPRYLNVTNQVNLTTVPNQDTSYSIYQPERYGYRIGQENIIPYLNAIIYNYQKADVTEGTHFWGRKSTDPMFAAAYPASDLVLSVGYVSQTQNGLQINGSGINKTIFKRVDDFDKINGYGGFAIMPSGIVYRNSRYEIDTVGTTLKAYWQDTQTTVGTYYWQKSTDGINWPYPPALAEGSGPTIPNYTITTLSSGDAGYYRCRILTNPVYPYNYGYIDSYIIRINYTGGVYVATWPEYPSGNAVGYNSQIYMINSDLTNNANDIIVRDITWDGNQTNNFTTNSPSNSGLSIQGTGTQISRCKFIDFGVGNTMYSGSKSVPGPGVSETFVVITGPKNFFNGPSAGSGPIVEDCIFTENGIKNGPDVDGYIPEYTCLSVHGKQPIVRRNTFENLVFDNNHRSPIHAISFGGTYTGSFYGNILKNVQGTCFYMDSWRVTGSKIQNNYISSSWSVTDFSNFDWPNPLQTTQYKNVDISKNTIILANGPVTYNYFVGQAGGYYPSYFLGYYKTSTMPKPYLMVTGSKNIIKRGYYDGSSGGTAGFSYITFPRNDGIPSPTTITASNNVYISNITSSSTRLISKLSKTLDEGQIVSFVVTQESNNPLSGAMDRKIQQADISSSNYYNDTSCIATTNVKNLLNNTQYYYWLYDSVSGNYISSSNGSGTLGLSYLGKFKTPPNAYEPYKFTASFAGCIENNSTTTLFKKIDQYNPNIFFFLGNVYYWSGSKQPVSATDYESAYQSTFASGSEYNKFGKYTKPRNLNYLTRNCAINYVYNSADYASGSADNTYINRAHITNVYKNTFPHPTLSGAETTYTSASVSVTTQPIYHSYKFGRVKFIITDNISERSPVTNTDDSSKNIWSSTQENWFLQQIKDTSSPLKVWINSSWLGDNTKNNYTDPNGWARYTTFRTKIANHLTAYSASIGKLIMLSGDNAMTAVDDGIYSSWYGTGSRTNPPITVYQNAPIDFNTSRRGGPYILSGSDFWNGNSIQYYTTNANYNKALTGMTSSYLTQNENYGCMELFDEMNKISVYLYSRENKIVKTSAGDPIFPTANSYIKMLKLNLDTSLYLSQSGGKIIETIEMIQHPQDPNIDV